MSRRDTVALALVLLLFVTLCAIMGAFHPDRSFIAYRYADHIAQGHGFVYNVGDAPSEAYGNSLWVILCAVLSRAGLSLPAVAPVLSSQFGVVALLVFWSCLRRSSGTMTTLALAGFAALSGPLAVAAASGEGVTLVITLCLTLLQIMSRHHIRAREWVLAAFAGALLATCGLYYALAFPLLMIVRSYTSHSKISLPGGVVFLLLLSAFHLWRVSTFGSFMPDNLLVDVPHASLSDCFTVQPHDTAPFGWFYLMLGIAAIAGATRNRSTLNTLSLVCAALVGAVTIATRDPLPGLATSAPFAMLLLVPAAGLTPTIAQRFRSPAASMVLMGSLFLTAFGGSMSLRTFTGYIGLAHDATLAPLSRWLVDYRHSATLLTDSPGAISYYTGWHTTAVNNRTSRVPSQTDVVILTSEGLFEMDMAEPSFAVLRRLETRYRLTASVRREWTRDRAVVVFCRADLPELTDEQQDAFPPGVGTIVRVNR